MTDPRNFLLTTDYPLDKIVYLASGLTNFTGFGDYSFDHNLPFTPLTALSWSYAADFSVSYFNNGGPLSSNPYTVRDQYITCEANDAQITLRSYGPNTMTNVYYRIYGFMPTDVEASVSATANIADNFVLSTDYNYPKLILNSYFDYAANVTINTAIAHNMGVIPTVICWSQSSSSTGQVNATGDDINGLWSISADTSNINFHLDQFNNLSSGRMHYRGYV